MTPPLVLGLPVTITVVRVRPRVICAWCLGEGVTTVIAEGDAHAPVSHGCCEQHERLLLAGLA